MVNKLDNETLAELLIYLADHEKFSALKKLENIREDELRYSLKALAKKLKAENPSPDIKKIKGVSKRSQEVLAALSPQESKRLLRAFSIYG